MTLPAVDPSVVDGVLVGLAGVVSRPGVARAALDDSAAQEWSGAAAGEFLALRGRVSGRVDVVADVAVGAAAVLESYAAEVSEALVRMRSAQREVEVVLAAHEAAVIAAGASGVGVSTAVAELEATSQSAWAAWEAARAQYVAAGSAAREGLTGLLQVVEEQRDAPLTLRGHVEAGMTKLLQEVVVDGWNGTWSLTGAAVTDRATWEQTWAGLPGGVWHAVTNPRETLKDAVAWQHWADGEWGEAVAGVGGTAAGIAMRKPGVPSKWAKHIADPNAPRPRTQSVEEWTAGVDLDASEHHDLGHTVRRHVVDRDYLEDRLTNGTLLDDGSRSAWVPKRASTWTDRETAEAVLTEALQEVDGLREWAASTEVEFEVHHTAPTAIGVVMTREGDRFVTSPARDVIIVLARRGDDIFIKTAYPT